MSFNLPKFTGTNLRVFTLCGDTSKNHKFLKKVSSKDEVKTYFVNSKGAKYFIRAALGGKSKRHVHIDLASPNLFKETKLKSPKANLNQANLFSDLSPLLGTKMTVAISGTYRIESKTLPAFISLLQELSFKKGKYKAGLVGGKMKFEGLQAESLQWQKIDKKYTRLTLVMRKELMFDQDYFLNAFKDLNEIYETIMLMEL